MKLIHLGTSSARGQRAWFEISTCLCGAGACAGVIVSQLTSAISWFGELGGAEKKEIAKQKC